MATSVLLPTSVRFRYSPPLLRKTLLALTLAGFLVAVRYASLEARFEPPRTIQVQCPLIGTIWNIEVADHGRPEAARRAIDQTYVELAH